MPTTAPAPPRDYRAEFPIFRRSVYLNSCSLGALSTRSRTRINQCLDLWDSLGAAAWYEIWWGALAELRARYARWIGAPEGSVALHPNISAGLTSIAESLDYRRRPKVVVTSLDFPTVAYQWLARAGEGVEVTGVESPDGVGVPLEALERAVDYRTALIATSHVFFTSGAIQDVRALAQLAHARGALLLVDGYHAAGQLPVDVQALDADFYCSGGLKWLLGGTGIVFLYVRADLARRLEPTTAGWFGHREQFAFDPHALEFHDDARRFELGTPALAAIYAQLGGLEYIEEIGVSRIREVTAALAEDRIKRAREAGCAPKVAADAAKRSAIVMLPMPDPAAAVRHLAEGGVVADARPGHVRLSPFFYNVQDDHVTALERLATHRGH